MTLQHDGRPAAVASRIETALLGAIRSCGQKPADDTPQATKKNYNEKLSAAVALVVAQELRDRGMSEARPSGPGEVGASGAERRLAGGIGAKKVDVTWATEESGLLLAVSVKTILFRDSTTRNYQKNLTNRRADLLNEAVTLHRRFPYAVLSAFLIFDAGAENDDTSRRKSTFENAGPRLRLFTGRRDPSGRDEQYEKFYVLLADLNVFQPSLRAYEVNDLTTQVPLDTVFEDLVTLLGERNFDLYEGMDGQVRKT
ncbi:hypothetical protein [Brachybacterium paraconglomeratum]|uniref:hypothetical protein n=1 Tax=Brachybacterium paraconglomeratum TaxID=173362 RepID=UPI0021A86E2D|nr:hypothetical protein [Brachybacterium paraconglomeratum]MCT1909514.1 hypothetical protein [Brachybacterium paraconglomeratum]